MPDRVVVADAITKRFGSRDAVRALSFTVQRGEIFALLGPNGADKTTCVRMLAGIIRPDAGRILVSIDGTVSAALPPAQSAYLPEDRGLYREIPILRTLTYFGRLRGLAGGEAERRARAWLERMGLADRAHERVDALSKGNQQRVQLAAALLHRPALLILDEPFTGLDPVSQEFFLDLVRELRAAGTTIVLSAHQMDLVERTADRVLLMNRGREILSGSIAELHARLDPRPRVRLGLLPGISSDVLRSDPDVDHLVEDGDGIEVLLREGAHAPRFFARALASSQVERISSEPARLHDVFLRAVREDDRRLAGGPRGQAMTHFRQAALVAEWEFTRYFKWRDQLLGLLVFLILGGAGYLAGRLATGTDRMLTVAVEGMDAAALQSGGRLRFVPAPGEPERTAALREGSLRGVLTRRPDGSFALLVETDPPYLGDLSALLDAITRRERLAEHGLGEADLERLLRPTALEIRYVDPERQRAGTGEKLVAGLVAALVILAVFTAMAYLLSGITGEKQLRVTESLISFVTPQAWIDGKILGIGAYALVNILNIVAGGVLMALIARLAWGFDLPNAAVRPATLMLLILFSTLALLLWNSLFAAFAATIDDPNTSARTSVMFVPMLFIGLAGWVVIRDPESPMAQGLALFPLTSPVALPGRAILSDVSFVETALSLVLLLAAIWLARRAAGRIFEIAILMYGKEPGLREMMQWLRVR